jgi:DTW domain-containing protein YfiP
MRARRPEVASVHRCPMCRLHRSLCICALVPTVVTRTRVVLVVHQLELRKPTNTGRLVARCLPNSAVLLRGGGAPADPSAAWGGDRAPVLLYPDRQARPIDQWRASSDPITLIVPDGTWRQAARARRRIPGLVDIPCAHLPEAASSYRLRQAARPGRLSTMEAVACALGALEGPEVEEQLIHILRVMIDRTLWTNGRLTAEQVTGGIPEGAVSHDPLSGSAATR